MLHDAGYVTVNNRESYYILLTYVVRFNSDRTSYDITLKFAMMGFISRYSAKTLECLASLPADGLSDICYNVIVSLIQHIVLHKPVSECPATAN